MNLNQRIRAKIISALVESTQEAATQAIIFAPIKTGDLRRSIRSEVDPSRLRGFIIAGGTGVPYAKFQEFGTFENRIDPSDVSRIRAALKSGISIKRGKGIAPKLFLHKGTEAARPRIIEIFEKKFNELAREIT